MFKLMRPFAKKARLYCKKSAIKTVLLSWQVVFSNPK